MPWKSPDSTSTRTILGWLVASALLVACSSQPSKYKRKKECDCPKWNRMAPAPGKSVRASLGEADSPYYCGPGKGTAASTPTPTSAHASRLRP